MPTLRVTGCRVERQAITISFSEAVDQTSALGSGSTNATRLISDRTSTIFAPGAGLFDQLRNLGSCQSITKRRLQSPGNTFNPGDWVCVTVKGFAPASRAGSAGLANPKAVSGRMTSIEARATRDVEDAFSSPILTEEIGYRSFSGWYADRHGGGGSCTAEAEAVDQTLARSP